MLRSLLPQICKSPAITDIVRRNCRAFRSDAICTRCAQRTYYLNSRADIYENIFFPLCERCQNLVDEERKQRFDTLLQERREAKSKKVIEMQQAYENCVYETLNPKKLRFLIILANNNTLENAIQQSGLSSNDCRAYLNELNNLNLIHFEVEEERYSLLNEFRTSLIQLRSSPAIKSIFNSPIVFSTYQFLKRKYLFVFPEIPVCVITTKEVIIDLFTQNWQERFFQSARVNLLVCDVQRKPLFAVDYDHHQPKSTKDSQKENFKKEILEAVGIPLKIVKEGNFQELNNL